MLLKRCIALIIGLLFILPAFAEDRRADKSRVKIMTYNTEFLWDGIEPEDGSENVTFPWKGNVDNAKKHMAKIASVIIENDPDIVNLVEVEGYKTLEYFNKNFLPGRGYKPYLVQGTDSFTGQDVGLLTRIDPADEKIFRENSMETIRGNEKYGVSKNYFAKFDLDGKRFSLIGLHFLSRPVDRRRQLKRQAQAKVILNRALKLSEENYPPIVLGDFNDYDEETRDYVNDRPITTAITSIKKMSESDLNDDLVNSSEKIAQTERYTAWWDKNNNGEIDVDSEYSAIDHILISKNLWSDVQSVYIDKSHDSRTFSDHFPVIVFLNTNSSSRESASSSLKIHSLLPNPSGDDMQKESVTLSNQSGADIDLKGWKLRDKTGKFWDLSGSGSAGPGHTVISRNRQEMELANSGDTIDLVDPDNNVVHSVTYSPAREDEIINVADGEPDPAPSSGN